MEQLPPLPDYTLKPLPPLLPPIPDKFLTLLLPIAAYWGLSMFFHWIDVNDYLSQYRLHTPAEVLKRNHVSRWEVIRDVVIQQVIQTVVGVLLGMTEPDDVYGAQDYQIAVWAQRTRIAQRFVPHLLGTVGVDAHAWSSHLATAHPIWAGFLSGGLYGTLKQTVQSSAGGSSLVPAFAPWEMLVARAVYFVLVPALQFALGIVFVDTWQYFLHRAMHMNKWMYTTFHARHHRLYVPYAFGALYNHPFEGFLLDILGASIAFKVAGMTTRQGMCFFTGSTIKTVDDHCGYALPWDPLQQLTTNNAGYHDIHHQSWGIKTNFSQPFFTFWDRVLGTAWTGGDVSARYERTKLAAQKKLEADQRHLAGASASTEPSHLRRRASSITNTDAADSDNKDHRPYVNELRDAERLRSIPLAQQLPRAPAGKAEQQAAASREQVLNDASYGGSAILAEEANEERAAQRAVQRSRANSGQAPSPMSPTATSAGATTSSSMSSVHRHRRSRGSLTGADGLRGLRERVSIHGRTGAILGMEHGH